MGPPTQLRDLLDGRSADELANLAAELRELADVFETISRRLVQLVDAPTAFGAQVLRVAEAARQSALNMRTLADVAAPPPTPAGDA